MKKLKVCGTCIWYESIKRDTIGHCYVDPPLVIEDMDAKPATVERRVKYLRPRCRHYRRNKLL